MTDPTILDLPVPNLPLLRKGVSGNTEIPAGTLVEFSGTGKVMTSQDEPYKLRIGVDGVGGVNVATLPFASVRVVVPPLKEGDVIDKAHREDLDRLPVGAILRYDGDPDLSTPQCWAKHGAVYRIPGSNTLFEAIDVTLPVRVLWVGGDPE